QREEIDLRRLVEGTVRRIESDASARDVRLSIDLADGVTLRADGAKLERALENLLDNARKYTPEGHEIRVRAYLEAGSACIEVANAAPDISAEEVPRLFERFYRRDRTRGGSTGSGLGLPIARDLIELHGGTLEASVADGEIVFTARLPLEG
ncbi:MAG: two-component sensor histidine kinase, partial [Chloroflexi bacterium]|nr:two-component sensor histidine kinase [Chloroflexota bacterium]